MTPLSDFIPISEAVARVVGRVMRRQRERPCTCHPSEAPVPCQRKYAFSECMTAFVRKQQADAQANQIKTDGQTAARAFAEPEIGG